ncbi:MAG: hypothetical protein PHP20_03205 [Firmicutes bacterium]|nr:hypothetical protein [Bacillota bacterium]MDD4335837.1 hypothetical protein [Bacillota bacterium]MDD4792048.1 hypothetical protein [Bacillota bacterium]
MEVASKLLVSSDLPVRFLRRSNSNGECPRLIFELTELDTIEETICLARRVARSLAASHSFPGGFCLEIVLQAG